ncbi:MAG TPA: hypothetical protein VHH73_13440, partial [Verrucomicrobiae bacterium]|nr:hypothetical protein [Verrucomicrobiae bacterium]
ENFKSLIIGGLSFATPNDPGPPAQPGTVFPLHEKPEDKWLKWTPSIALTNAKTVVPSSGIPGINLDPVTQSQNP